MLSKRVFSKTNVKSLTLILLYIDVQIISNNFVVACNAVGYLLFFLSFLMETNNYYFLVKRLLDI